MQQVLADLSRKINGTPARWMSLRESCGKHMKAVMQMETSDEDVEKTSLVVSRSDAIALVGASENLHLEVAGFLRGAEASGFICLISVRSRGVGARNSLVPILGDGGRFVVLV